MSESSIYIAYLGILILAIFESYVALLIAGMAAYQGVLSFIPAMLAGYTGTFVGDLVWYTAGRYIVTTDKLTGITKSINQLAIRFGIWELLISRLLYGTRVPTMLFWGCKRLSIVEFVILNSIGCLSLSLMLSSLGYLLSNILLNMKVMEEGNRNWLLWLLISIVVTLFFYILGKAIRNYII
jgi:membrane protein DedA with SNARE-associated domain